MVLGIVLMVCILPICVSGATNINAGIINGVWFSKLPFFTGDKIVIYTAFQNQSGKELNGTIEFVHNESVIGSKPFTAKAGEFITRSINWTTTYGDHTFKVRIKELVDDKGVAVSPVAKTDTEVQSQIFFGDNDTDGDDTGDEVDTDDDNDGVPDIQEKKDGTDPKKSDTDGDGVPDNLDKDPLVPDKVASKTVPADSVVEDIVPNVVLETVKNIIDVVDTTKDSLAVFVDQKADNVGRILESTKSTNVATTTTPAKADAAKDDQTSTVDEHSKNKVLLTNVEYWILVVLGFLLRYDIVFYSIPAIIFIIFLRHMFNKYKRPYY